jgi:GT2 family glycosyltransferase
MLEGKPAGGNRATFELLAVIVLYKMQPSESAAFRSLQSAISGLALGQSGIRILLYDNTPGGCDPGPLPEGVQYEAAGQNAGLAAAYNHALAIARREKDTWLLILDQDTTLPSNYLSRN